MWHKEQLQALLGVSAAVVLVTAVILARWRQADFLRRAAEHGEKEQCCLNRPVTSWDGFARDADAAEYHAGLRRKYERAARYPWLRVEPDPPAPE